MNTALLLLYGATVNPGPPAKDWIGDAVLAHRSLNSVQLKLQVQQVLDKSSTRMSYEIAFVRPDQVLIKIMEPQQNGRPRSNRTFVLVRDKFFGYDAEVHERLQRPAAKDGDLFKRLSASLDNLFDEAVAVLLDPKRMENFLSPLRSLKGWKLDNSRGLAKLTLPTGRSGAKGQTRLAFDSSTNLLRELRIDVPKGRLEWNIAYTGKPKAITYRPPVDAAVVSSFTQRREAPLYASAAARQVAERSIRAYDRLKRTNFRIDLDGKVSTVWIDGATVREDTPSLNYVWNAGSARILIRGRKTFYSGPATLNRFMDALGALGSRMDPLVRHIVTRRNPVRMLLVPGMKVRSAGKLNINGANIDILEFQNEAGRVSMGIRADNGLLASIRTVLFDPKGKKVSEGSKSFTYLSVGKPIPPATFQIKAPSGYSKVPIASLKK